MRFLTITNTDNASPHVTYQTLCQLCNIFFHVDRARRRLFINGRISSFLPCFGNCLLREDCERCVSVEYTCKKDQQLSNASRGYDKLLHCCLFQCFILRLDEEEIYEDELEGYPGAIDNLKHISGDLDSRDG